MVGRESNYSGTFWTLIVYTSMFRSGFAQGHASTDVRIANMPPAPSWKGGVTNLAQGRAMGIPPGPSGHACTAATTIMQAPCVTRIWRRESLERSYMSIYSFPSFLLSLRKPGASSQSSFNKLIRSVHL
mmetsp:Transcript_31929/g.123873  ORF Transcript_31929/g.123873 Transcript_31929/m.123873 type:complete len:129 (-) Transcript_31929:1639-2025(-)